MTFFFIFFSNCFGNNSKNSVCVSSWKPCNVFKNLFVNSIVNCFWNPFCYFPWNLLLQIFCSNSSENSLRSGVPSWISPRAYREVLDKFLWKLLKKFLQQNLSAASLGIIIRAFLQEFPWMFLQKFLLGFFQEYLREFLPEFLREFL